MKDLLKFIGSCQNQFIAGIRQKKDASHLGNVAGVNLGGDIDASKYNDLLTNVDGFVKEAKQFKEDSSKIILEKNSLLRSLEDSDYVFFRNVKENGDTTVRTNERFLWGAKFENVIYFYSFLLCIPLIFILFTETDKQLVFRRPFPNVVFLVYSALILWFAIYQYFRQRKYSKWLKYESQKPEHLFSKGNDMNGVRHSINLQIDLSSKWLDAKHINSTSWYVGALKEITILSSKLGGRMGWFWNYSSSNASDDDYVFKHGEYNFNLVVSIQNNSDNLLSFIETDHSFIFHLPPGYKGIGGFESSISDSEKERVSSLFEKEKEKMFLSY